MTVVPLCHADSASRLLLGGPVNDFRDLVAVETADEVVLVGIVRSYYLKQMAQEVVRPALAGRRLRNRLVVIPE
jgi:hypothetical protein